ncbi:hypothetical protein LQZ18_04145 [Lachnospiraceae bacterium ZAX-1]
MSEDEVARMLYLIRAEYQKQFSGMSGQDFSDKVKLWHSILCKYDLPVVQAGLRVFLTTEKSGFAPTVSQIVNCIHKITDREADTMTELEAWGFVYKAICRSGYYSEEEFELLPDIVKTAVGSPARLKEWSGLPIDEVQTVIQSNFMRSFRAVQKRESELKRMPSDIRNRISVQQNKKITQEA